MYPLVAFAATTPIVSTWLATCHHYAWSVTLTAGGFTAPIPLRRGFPAHFGLTAPAVARVHCPTSPHGYPVGIWFGLYPFRSPLLRASLLVSLPPPTKMFPFGGFPLRGLTPECWSLFGPSGKLHSGIPGSKPACGYPGLIAACHALPRRPSRAIHRAA